MKEVFEDLIKEGIDMYEDAIRHTDVVRLLKDLKIQKVCADAQLKRAELAYNKPGVHDPSEDEQLELDIIKFAQESETFKYVIDVIESGKFAGESE